MISASAKVVVGGFLKNSVSSLATAAGFTSVEQSQIGVNTEGERVSSSWIREALSSAVSLTTAKRFVEAAHYAICGTGDSRRQAWP